MMREDRDTPRMRKIIEEFPFNTLVPYVPLKQSLSNLLIVLLYSDWYQLLTPVAGTQLWPTDAAS